MGRKIVVTSGKGGVGKTTIVAGLAKSLAQLNASVCVVDGDIGLNNLDLIMNVENKVVYDLVDCMAGKCRIKQAIIKDDVYDNLFTLPSGKNLPMGIVNSFDAIVNKLATIFDFVLIDCPAGKDEGFRRASMAATEAVVVVTPHIASVRDASKILTLLSGDKSKLSVSVVVNRLRGDMVASGEMMSHTDIAGLLNANILGVLPESDSYNVSSSIRFIGSNDEFKQALLVLAKNLIDGTNEQFNYTAKYMGVVGFFRRKLKRL